MTTAQASASSTRHFVAALALSASLCVQGCANYQVRIPDSKPLNAEYKRGTMHALFWGFWASPQVMSADCKRGINDVVVKSNYLYDLATVVTLGIWMPIEVSYRCKAPAVQGGGVLGE